MEADPLFLSRLQFAFLIVFHFLLPAFTIGLASYIAVLEGVHLWTRNPVYLRLSNFWIKIFAVSFGLGVVSGIVMPFQFGTNWSRFSEVTGNIIAPLMGYEGLMAFFLEATFLGVLLFGRSLVPVWAHFGAAVLVAFGTLLSAFWILAANSWMQTPAGFEIVDGVFVATDWMQVIFNPSFPFRFFHTVTAVYLTTAFTVIGVAAYHLLHRQHLQESKIMIAMGFGLASILVPLQLVLGDLHGLNTLEHQPAKLAAMEGIWETGPGQPAILFAIPDEAAERNHAEIGIPNLASLYLTHDWQGEVVGLKDFKREDRPPVAPVFWGFRAMVAMWAIMMALTVCAWYLALRGQLYERRGFLRACIGGIPSGYIAVTAGWITTEVGRQPWVVHELLRTRDAVTPFLSGGDVIASLTLYVIVYVLIFGAGFYFLVRLARRGPQPLPEDRGPRMGERPARPLSAATESE
ncbi:MAG TPA: cytochrome ubiquinol oxidase subunit I [Burkholderiales bacterium]|nr:cytochrome ubiquinol oxidase subunit I [Burkholderiales bacterium]